MVKGLDLFRSHFRPFSDRFVLICGTACDMAMTEAGLEFRATKDLDIVLWVEALDKLFVEAFWEFVRAGRYQIQQKSTGERRSYRFQKPEETEYPLPAGAILAKARRAPARRGRSLDPAAAGGGRLESLRHPDG